jgi:hypothetical protein
MCGSGFLLYTCSSVFVFFGEGSRLSCGFSVVLSSSLSRFLDDDPDDEDDEDEESDDEDGGSGTSVEASGSLVVSVVFFFV